MRTIFKWINIFFSVGLVFITLGVAYIAIPYFGNQALIVRSGSMSPAIDAGSIVVVRPDNKFISPIVFTPIYNEGDIIAFRSENNPKTIITHRIVSVEVEKNGIFYKTKGDANKSVDGWLVDEQNILGKTFFTLPFAGRLLAFTKSNIGFPLLVIFPAVLVILLEIRAIYKEIRRQKALFQTQPSSNVSVSTLRVLLPIFMFMTIVVFGSTSAFFSDSETSVANTFTAADVFPHLVINEVLYDTSSAQNITGQGGSNRGEWVEIYNPTSSSVDITGWDVVNDGEEEPLSGTLPAGGYLIISGASRAEFEVVWPSLPVAALFVQTSDGTIGNGLANGGDAVVLQDNTSSIVDQMSWGTDITGFSSGCGASCPTVSSGHSFERDPVGFDTDDAGDFVDRETPTPGS